jgi:hypothetical protein
MFAHINVRVLGHSRNSRNKSHANISAITVYEEQYICLISANIPYLKAFITFIPSVNILNK